MPNLKSELSMRSFLCRRAGGVNSLSRKVSKSVLTKVCLVQYEIPAILFHKIGEGMMNCKIQLGIRHFKDIFK